ncbi:hypothetical protein [Acaryochloris marina]|nr:hypothetical protein [Acaryochloris marina]QUY45551.1 hypothetical protein I1H34_27750 [Acaryochloris marina S15]
MTVVPNSNSLKPPPGELLAWWSAKGEPQKFLRLIRWLLWLWWLVGHSSA